MNVKNQLFLFVFTCLPLTFSPAAEVVINEFMAVNDSTLQDEDLDYSDWIELYNPGPTNINLAGWFLTDTTNIFTKWKFPNLTLFAGSNLIVFASNKDRTNAASELHTNFRLSGDGEYLGLIRPDGVTVEYDFGPEYPDQDADQSFGLVREEILLVPGGAAGRYLVPRDGALGTTWTGGAPFDDSSWSNGQAVLGYDLDPGGLFNPLIFTGVTNIMQGSNDTIYLRVPFTVSPDLELESMDLRMRFDDGFIAYLNGQSIASSKAPGSPMWNSAATAAHPDLLAIQSMSFPIAGGPNLLQASTNVLALQGLTVNPEDPDPDFFLAPEIAAVQRIQSYLITPTPGMSNSPGAIVANLDFTPNRSLYDAPVMVTITADVPGVAIHYTTDFSEPSTNSPLYTGPISVNKSTIIRAAAFRPGYQASDAETHSYLFFDSTLSQPADPPGFPAQWHGQNARYEMDPNVMNNYSYNQMVDYLRHMPSISIVSTMENLFDDSTGIYENPTSRGVAWERPASVEWIYGDGSNGFGVNCGLRIQGGLGGGGRSYRKKSWRFLFKTQYGPGKLRFNVFDWDDDAVQSFDQITLRGGGSAG
ncbi:MAG: FN3 associated domain-containing protein [Verrucomicrobiota bacterium]